MHMCIYIYIPIYIYIYIHVYSRLGAGVRRLDPDRLLGLGAAAGGRAQVRQPLGAPPLGRA